MMNDDPQGYVAFDNFNVLEGSQDCGLFPPAAFPTECKANEFRCVQESKCINIVRDIFVKDVS